MEITKEYLERKILMSLFFNEEGSAILKPCNEYFEKNNITPKKIISEFKILDDMQDKNFWASLLEIVNECFGSELQINDYNLDNEEDFKNLLNDILIAKFDFVFEPTISKKIKNKELLKKSLGEIKEKNEEVIEIPPKDGINRLIVPVQKKYYIYAEPHVPTELPKYPNVLIKINENEEKITFGSKSKHAIERIIDKIESSDGEDEEVLEEFYEKDIEDMEIDVNNFFRELKEEGFYIKEIKFKGPQFYFTAGAKITLDLEKLVDVNFYLNSPRDFVNIHQIKMTYTKNIGNATKDFDVKVKFITHEDKIRFGVHIMRNRSLNASIEKEILDNLERVGIKQDVSFKLPLEYYLTKLLYQDGSVEALYKMIEEMKNGKEILDKLTKQKIIIIEEDGKIDIDEETVIKYIASLLSKLKGKPLKKDKEEFIINKVNVDKKRRININIRFSSPRSGSKNEDYEVIIYDDVRGYEKILHIVLYRFDRGYVVSKMLGRKKREVLEYLYNRVKSYLLYEYEIQLQKEANAAHKWLKDYTNRFQEMEKKETPQKLGNIVEKRLNIIMKYLFRNYLPLGGSKKPDGYLYYSGKGFLIDSKQHKNIKEGEIDKMARYLFDYCKSNGLPETDMGVLIFCRGKLGNYLNKDAINRWKSSKEFREMLGIGFASIEFILELFEISKKQEAKAFPELKEKLLDAFYDVVESKDFSKKEELVKKEEESLENLKRELDRHTYIPQEEREI